MIVINVYKDFLVDSKFSNYLEEIKTKIPHIKLQYTKSFTTDLAIHFQITMSNNNNNNSIDFDYLIRKMYSFN